MKARSSATALPLLSSPNVPPLVQRASSQPATPGVAPPPSPLLSIPSARPRLLMPTVREPRRPSLAHASPTGSPKSPKVKNSSTKIIRSRSASLSISLSPSLLHPPKDTGAEWLGFNCKFEIVQEQLEIEGYQIHAVEKWVTERTAPVVTLAVYTGDPEHKITVTALSPCSSLSIVDTQAEWDRVIRELRQSGARPKETVHGTLMVTSLANFRSDYTIVHVPSGSFLEARERLYTNINLLRMGCAGRTALTLEEPSDTTKDRFIGMYNLPDKLRSTELFGATTLELVKLVQAGLSIFGKFDLSPEERNGLLCDVTVNGIQRWIAEIGEPCLGVEPMERVADPTIVSALLSLVACIRNKLYALGYGQLFPKDPFIEPHIFVQALLNLPSARLFNTSINTAITASLTNASPPHTSTSPSSTTANSPSKPKPLPYLTQETIEAIDAAYTKFRQAESYKVHRVLLNKLDDFTTDLRTSTSSAVGGGIGSIGGGHGHGHGHHGHGHGHSSSYGGSGSGASKDGYGYGYGYSGYGGQPVLRDSSSSRNDVPIATGDMEQFVRIVQASGKDGAASLRYLWSGRLAQLEKKRSERVMFEVEREKEEDRERDREKERNERSDGRSTEDESESRGWTGRRVQRKIESWTGLNRKKQSVDLSAQHKHGSKPSVTGDTFWVGNQSPPVPEVVISREDGEEEELLSSGQASPASQQGFYLNTSSLTVDGGSATNLSDYDRRLSEFNHKRPRAKPAYQSRITSWSDPLSARRGITQDETLGTGAGTRRTSISERESLRVAGSVDEGYSRDDISVLSFKPYEGQVLTRRRSFDDASRLKALRVLPVDRMKIDVDLCGQLLIMRRRDRHLEGVIAVLQVLTSRLSSTNARMRSDYESHQALLTSIEHRSKLIGEIELIRARTSTMLQETHALSYESEQFRVQDLWHSVAPQRRNVIAMRDKVFGTNHLHAAGANGQGTGTGMGGRGSRLPQGSHGAHGRFNRLQWTLSGEERLVDALGRTESEAEEEEGLPEEGEEEEEDVGPVETGSVFKPGWLLKFFESWGARWPGGLKPRGKKVELPEAQVTEGTTATDGEVVESIVKIKVEDESGEEIPASPPRPPPIVLEGEMS